MIDTKKLGRGISADMKPHAIERRLKMVAELNQLCAALGKTRLGAGKK
jgi:hypothetical protein